MPPSQNPMISFSFRGQESARASDTEPWHLIMHQVFVPGMIVITEGTGLDGHRAPGELLSEKILGDFPPTLSASGDTTLRHHSETPRPVSLTSDTTVASEQPHTPSRLLSAFIVLRKRACSCIFLFSALTPSRVKKFFHIDTLRLLPKPMSSPVCPE